MNKKIISLLVLTMTMSTSLISCNKTSSSQNTEKQNNTTVEDSSSKNSEQQNNSNADNSTSESSQNSKIIDNNPTIDVNKIVSISDLKNKTSDNIKAILGDPVSENNNVLTYKKDGYTFDITYFDSICGQIKVTPDAEMNYPADATNILKVFGINGGDSDTISPVGLAWNNKFDTFSISVVPDENNGSKLGSVQVILEQKYQ